MGAVAASHRFFHSFEVRYRVSHAPSASFKSNTAFISSAASSSVFAFAAELVEHEPDDDREQRRDGGEEGDFSRGHPATVPYRRVLPQPTPPSHECCTNARLYNTAAGRAGSGAEGRSRRSFRTRSRRSPVSLLPLQP